MCACDSTEVCHTPEYHTPVSVCAIVLRCVTLQSVHASFAPKLALLITFLIDIFGVSAAEFSSAMYREVAYNGSHI